MRAALGVLLIGALTACGGGASGSPDPNVSPKLLSAAQERKITKKALLTAADLGKPWVVEKDEPEDKATQKATDKATEEAKDKPDEFCPGQPGIFVIAPPRAIAEASFTAGTEPGAAIGAFEVATLHPGQERMWRDAIATVAEGCRTYRDENGFYVTATDIEKPPRVKGADQVIGLIERIHEDIQLKKLLYVRHYLYTRNGRLVCMTQHAFIQPKSDPTGSDLAQVVKLASKQVAKANVAFRG